MQAETIEQRLMEAFVLDLVRVSGDGNHFEVTAVGELFDGLSRVKQQQLIYRPFMDEIADNTIHALTIKAYTPAQWQAAQKFGQL